LSDTPLVHSQMHARRLAEAGCASAPTLLPGLYDGPIEGLAASGARAPRVVFAGRHIPEKNPVAVVLDARLPVMSGREFVSVVRAYSRLASVPIVLLTAWDAPDSFAKSVDAVMRKPFRPDELVATVEALIVRNPSAAAG